MGSDATIFTTENINNHQGNAADGVMRRRKDDFYKDVIAPQSHTWKDD